MEVSQPLLCQQHAAQILLALLDASLLHELCVYVHLNTTSQSRFC